MRIAMIGAKGLPSLNPVGGGVETHVEHLARHLVARGHHVTVYVRKYANPENKKTLDGIKIVTIPSWNRKNFDAITHVFLSTLHALGEPFDVLHYHGVGPATLCWIPRIFKRKARTIVTFHSRDQFHEKWGLLARMYLAFGEWAACKFPHATITTSHGLELLCKIMFHVQTYQIPNGVEVQRGEVKHTKLSEFGLEPNDYFFSLARLVPHKAQDDAIKAFRKLDTHKKLVIAGSASFDDNKYAEELYRLAKGDKRIIFTGHQTGETLKELIANCSALIHPSRSEGLSVAVLEAMSYGKIVVMSDIPENLELIDHSGISFKVGNIEALVKAMQWVLDDPLGAQERGERAQEIIKRLYSWDAVIRHVEGVYKSKAKAYDHNLIRNRETQAAPGN